MVLKQTPASKDIDKTLDEIESALKSCDKKRNDEDIIQVLEDVTEKLNVCKSAIRSYERELRMNDVASTDLQEWKSVRVQRLKSLHMVKKNKDTEIKNKVGLFGNGEDNESSDAIQSTTNGDQNELSNQELMEQGRSLMREDRKALERSKRLLEETKDVGAATAEALHSQTKQMERIINDLDEIKFTLKTAGNLVRELTKSLATDKCIMTFMMLVVIGVVVVIGMKIAGFDINGGGGSGNLFFAPLDLGTEDSNTTATNAR